MSMSRSVVWFLLILIAILTDFSIGGTRSGTDSWCSSSASWRPRAGPRNPAPASTTWQRRSDKVRGPEAPTSGASSLPWSKYVGRKDSKQRNGGSLFSVFVHLSLSLFHALNNLGRWLQSLVNPEYHNFLVSRCLPSTFSAFASSWGRFGRFR